MFRCRKATSVGALLALALWAASISTRPMAATPAAPNYQGLWWKAPASSESGWGINFAHQGDVIFASWFTYDATGKGLWLVMTASKTAEGVYTGAFYQTHGPAFSAVPFDPNAVSATQVGSGTLTFNDASNGSFAYTVNGITQTKAITRQVFGPMPSCTFGAQADLSLATNYQDLWWAAPAGNESGWGVNFTHQGDTIFATWFTYDADGTPLWLVATAPKAVDGFYTGTLYRTSGPSFDTVPFLSANVVATAVGTLTLTFANGNNATFAYTVNGVAQSKAITRQVFRTPGTTCQYTEGVWAGTTSLGETAHALVVEGGAYYIFYTKAGSATDAAVITGTSTMDGGSFSSSDGMNFPVAQAEETGDLTTPVTLTGSYTPRTDLQLNFAGASGARTLAATFVAGSDQPGSLTAVAGNYSGISGHTGGRRSAIFSIDAGEALKGSNGACSFAGTVKPRQSGNVFDFSVYAVGVETCIFNRGPIGGVAYYDEAARQFHGFASFFGTELWYLIGTKP